MSEFMNNIFMNNIYVIREYNKLVDLHNKMRKESDKLHSKIDKLEGKNHISERDQEKIDKLKVKYKAMMDKLKELSDAIDTIDRIEETIKDEKREMPNYIGTPDEADFKRRHKQNCDLYETYVNDVYEKYEDIIKKMRFKPTKKQFIIGGGVTLSAIALLLALRYGPEMVDKNKNSNQNPDGSNPSNSNGDNNNPSGSNQPNPDKEQNKVVIPELEQEELAEIIKVEDESLIPERAQDLLGYLNIIAPDHGLTLEEVTTYLNYKNGFVNNTTQEPTQNPVETPTTGTFTDINDEEKLYERVNGIIVPVYNNFAPQYGVDEAYAVNMFNSINGGVVEDPSRESCLDVIRTAEVLMNSEYLYAVDMKNKGESLREESTATIDYGIFFLDGSKAQVIASKMSDYRRRIITAPTSEDANKASIEFTEFLMNSWYLQGNNGEISLYAIKNSGQAAFLDKLFLNTADLAQANQKEDHQVTVINPLTGDEITLREIIEEINAANCLVEKEADNGEIFTQYVNKFSADMDGMYKETVSAKNQKSEEFTYGLNYNKK